MARVFLTVGFCSATILLWQPRVTGLNRASRRDRVIQGEASVAQTCSNSFRNSAQSWAALSALRVFSKSSPRAFRSLSLIVTLGSRQMLAGALPVADGENSVGQFREQEQFGLLGL